MHIGPGTLHQRGLMRTSVWCWMTNGVIPLWMTKNKPSSALSGEFLILLICFKLIWLQASYCKYIAFIANQSDDAMIFTEGNIGKALRRLGYTHKVTLTVDIRHLLSTI